MLCNLNICMWNINGFKIDKLIENIDFFKRFDLILLCETWHNLHNMHNFDIKDYTYISSCRARTNRKAKRNSGGLLCYVKDIIKEGIEQISCYKNSDDRIWIKLHASFFGFKRDVFLCLVYISPETSTHQNSRDNLWLLLEDEIAQFSTCGHIIITGDFNARTGSLPDFILNDSSMHIPLPHDYVDDETIARVSKDKTMNNYGRDLIDLCIAGSLRIVNGRINPDKRSSGSFTCYNPRGCSVVDYAITSARLLHEFESFKVGDITTFSDHCPLTMQLHTSPKSMFQLNQLVNSSKDLLESVVERLDPGITSQKAKNELPKRFKIDDVFTDKIKEYFSTVQFQQYLEILNSNLTKTSANDFTIFLQKTTERIAGLSERKRNKHSKNSFPQNSWFDDECKKQKRKFKDIARKFKQDPTDPHLKSIFWQERKAYKTLTKNKKRKSIAKLHQELQSFKSEHPKEFWRKISMALGNEVKISEPQIQENVFGQYFESLYDGPPNTPQVKCSPGSETNPILDDSIDEEEVRSAINSLKNNKSPGNDGLPPSIFKAFNSQLINFTTKLFNSILIQGNFPDSWSVGLLKPIHKKGDKKIPSNYRGITILPVMSKIFTAILRDRISYWADNNQLINESQFGFRKNRRTTDAIFIITTIVQARKKHKRKLYSCFVDFAKAFDSVNQHLLWKKLASLGMSQRMLNMLQNMYVKASSKVVIENSQSHVFRCKKGVRQGCNLSPLLFCLFLSDLEHHLTTNDAGNAQLHNMKVNLICGRPCPLS